MSGEQQAFRVVLRKLPEDPGRLPQELRRGRSLAYLRRAVPLREGGLNHEGAEIHPDGSRATEFRTGIYGPRDQVHHRVESKRCL